MRAKRHGVRVVAEQLEPRQLLASYNVADYFPMPTGATWSYAGTEDGAAYTETESYAPTTFNGHSVICDAATDVMPSGTVRYRTYVTLDSGGMQIYGERIRDTDGTIRTLTYNNYPTLVLPSTVSDGQVTSWPYTSLFVVESSQTFWGSESGSSTVNGIRRISLPNGRSFDALRITTDHAIALDVPVDGQTVTVTTHEISISWQVQGVGCVRTRTTSTTTYSNGASPETSTDIMNLTASSLLPSFASLSNGILTVNGTGASDQISVSLVNGFVLANLNGQSATFNPAQVHGLVISGYAGDDSISVGPGLPAATIAGGGGNDSITGGAGADFVTGGAGNDTVSGNAGRDTLKGGLNDDLLAGGPGADLLVGNAGNDTLNGQGGRDTLDGGAGDDVLTGGAGYNVFSGGDGSDVLYARNGLLDTLDGGTGNDSAQIDSLLDNVISVRTLLA